MADLRIADAPELDESEVQGGLKIPTGGFGNKAINMNTVASWVVKDKDLPSKDYVDTAVAQGNQGLSGHVANKNNPHEVTKEQVGLGNVDNTADADKPISNAASAALNLKADKTQLDAKADKTELQGLATTTQLDAKADKSATYTKTEVYSKDEVDSEILENGAALPYDPQLTYNDGAIVVDNGTLKKVEGGSLVNAVDAESVSIGDSTLDIFAEELAPLPEKLSRENVSVWDFFTTQELVAYKSSPTTFDASRPLIEFFDYISANDTGEAYCSGVFSTTQTIVIGRNGTQATKVVKGRLVLKDLTGLDAIVRSETGNYFKWDGVIDLTGFYVGSAWTYTNKRTRLGLLFPNGLTNSRCNYGTVRTQHVRQAGVYAENGTTLSQIDRVYGNGIGTGYHARQHTTTWSDLVNSGTQGSIGQRSTIKVDVLPEADLTCQMYIYNEGVLHLIHDIDRTNNTISVHPWIVTTNTTGTLEYVWGAGLDVNGVDSSDLHVNVLDVTNSAIGLVARSLYLPSISECCVQLSRIGITQGATAQAAGSGGYIGNYYTEGMVFDLVFVTSYGRDGRLPILSSYETRIDRVAFVLPRTANGEFSALGNTATGFQYNYKGYNYFCESPYQPFKAAAANNIIPTDLFSQNLYRQVYNKNVSIFQFSNFTAQNIAKARLFGLSTGLIHVMGSGINGSPTSVTFSRQADADYKINGQDADVVFTNFNGVAEFVVYVDVRAKNYIVKLVNPPEVQLVSITEYDPPSIAAKSTEVTTVNLQGVSVGQPIVAAFSQYDTGIKINAVVSATDTVTVSFENTTDVAIDLASGTLTVKAI